MKTKQFTLILLLALLLPYATHADVVSIGNGQTFSQSPFYSWYCTSWDEEIYPMSAFSGSCIINSVSYNNVGVYGMMFAMPTVASSLKIYLGERTTASHSSNTDWTPLGDLTLVYSHENVVIGAECGWVDFVFDEPFTYEHNGNLVIVIACVYASPAWDVNLYASSFSDNGNVTLHLKSTNPSISGIPEYPTGAGLLSSEFANIQLNVTPVVITCHSPQNLAVSDITSSSAKLTWTPGIGTSAWDVYVTDGEAPSPETIPTATAITTTNYTLTGLNSLTNYSAFIRSNCGGGDVSTWKSVGFLTALDIGGNGTLETPFLLYTKDDIDEFSRGLTQGFDTEGKYFKVMSDIEEITTPIVGGFRGDLNGNNHTITLNLEGEGNLALFTWLGDDASIHDLTVDGYVHSTNGCAAGFVAAGYGIQFKENVSITDCINRASIATDSDYAGGFVGNGWYIIHSNIVNCVNRGNISASGDLVGGILGNSLGFEVRGCINRGNVMGGSICGGIAGKMQDASIINCANYGQVTCSDKGGGIVGEKGGGYVGNCYNRGALSFGTNSGGISGYNWNLSHIENCYNAGAMTASNTTNCGALSGFNRIETYTTAHCHNNYYLEGTYSVAYGTESDMSGTHSYTSFTQAGNLTDWTLAEPILNTTDLLTVLNLFASENDGYVQWYDDIYGNNNYFPTFDQGMPPGLAIIPNPIVMAPRPIGAWMQGEQVTLSNTSQEDLQITRIDFDDNFFVVDESLGTEAFPFLIYSNESKEVFVGTDPDAIVLPGNMTAHMAVMWNQTHIKLADIEVNNYTSVSPDVAELAELVAELPQTITRSTDDLYNNYKLPGNKVDAADAVYKLMFSDAVLLNAEVTLGSNAKLALYAEDFAGRPGPMADNYIDAVNIGNNGQYSISIGGDNPITNLMVTPGTYYLVVSTTSPQYTLQISTNELPLPLQAAFVAPIDGATGITSPVQLQWQLGSFTSEYQLLIGTTYPPNEVLVDWTTELAESYVVDNLHNNQIYFWRVNERNASGTTNGSVWGFTTTLNIPSGLHANTPIHIGDDVLLEWNAVSGRAIVGYNVYQDGEKINEAPITATEYIVSDLAYNMEGYTFAVTAVYNEGESGMSEPVMVCVGGIGTISGTVYEQDGSTPIVGVAVTVTGYDEFLERHTYIYLTEANGTFSGTVYSGKYIAIASKEGYQEGSHGSEVLVSNDAETSYVDIILYENYNTTGRVVAEYYPDSLNSESPYVKVYWESENVPEPIGPGWHTYCENEFNNAVACVKWGYQYPLSELQPYIGFMMTKVALFSDKLFGAVGGNYTCRIYVGGTEPEEGEMVSTITVDVPQNLGDWVEFDLTNPVEISGIEPVWVIWQANTTVSDYPAGCCLGFNTYGTWCWSDDGYDWTHNPYGIWTMKQFFTGGEGRIVDRSFQHYNVYRTNCYNNGPYTEENTVLLASEVTDTIFIETGWPDVEQGVYKWGVSRVYGGNRESETACSKSDSYENRAQVLLRSINAYSFSRYSRIIPNGWVQYDPLHPQNSATLIDQNLQLCAGDFANDGYMHAFTEENQLLTFDPSSGQIVATVNTTTHMDDCAFDYSTGTMFGVKDNVLYSIDLESGSLSALGFLDHGAPSHCIRALACSYSGQLYGFLDEFGALFAIEKSSAHCTLIQQIAMLLSTDMTAGFDHNAETLYWMCVGIPDEGTGFIASVDVNTGNIIYLASGMGIQKCFSVPYGYVPIPVSPESEIVWSNCLDKDMWTTVEVGVSTNTGDSPAGTSVRFLNTSEPDQGYDYIVTLDNSGYYKWDRFRKGTYNYTIEKDGYTSCGNHEIIEIMRPDSIGCILEELPLNVRNLYVSHTGWAMWQQGLGGDVLHYDTDTFDGSVGASGSPFYWAVRFTPEQLEGFHSVNSVSFYDAPDQAFIGTFYVCSTGSPLGHILYQKDIVTTGSGQYIDYPLERDVVFDDTQDLWIVFQFKEGEATYPASASTNTGDLNGRLISSNGLVWDDVAVFGLNYTWKIRCHVKAEEEERTLEYYSVFLNGIFVGNTTETYFQHDVDNLVEGEINTTKVKAMYSMGESLWAEYTWTYIPCDEYESTSDLEAEVNNGHVLLNWTLPENQISGGEWYYYDNSINSGSVGTGGGSFYWGIMIPVGSWSGHYLGKVSIYDMAAYTGNILIYQGGQTAPGTLIYSQPFVSAGSNQWGEYPINDLVELDESQNLWVVFNNVGSASYPASYSEDSGDPNGRWISMDGVGWHDLTEYDIQGTWMIRAYATNEEPVVYDILGTYVFRDSELITEMPLPRTINTFVDNLPTADEHEYSVRVVYNNLPIYQDNYYAMSCPVSETVSNVLDVSDNKDGVVVNIYPNPAKDKVVIQAKGMRHVTIADALGQVVHDTDQKADRMILSMSQFESGLYLIQVTTERGMVTRRVTVVR